MTEDSVVVEAEDSVAVFNVVAADGATSIMPPEFRDGHVDTVIQIQQYPRFPVRLQARIQFRQKSLRILRSKPGILREPLKISKNVSKSFSVKPKRQVTFNRMKKSKEGYYVTKR